MKFITASHANNISFHKECMLEVAAGFYGYHRYENRMDTVSY